MKISISAIGRLRNSPEKELIDNYLSRFSKLSKPFGLSLNSIVEIGPGKILTGMNKRINRDNNLFSVSNLDDINKFLEKFKDIL